MKFAHQFIDIACSHSDAMALFADPMRLHEWAIAYCQGVARTADGFVAQTVEGPRCFEVRADRETGIADVMTGSSHDLLDDAQLAELIDRVGGHCLKHLPTLEFLPSPEATFPLLPADCPPSALLQDLPQLDGASNAPLLGDCGW